MSEVKFHVDLGFSWHIKEVFCQWEQVLILFGHFIETTEINTEMEIAILFPNKEHRGSMWTTARTYKSDAEMLIQKLAEFTEFRL